MMRSEEEVKDLIRLRWREAEAIRRVIPDMPYMSESFYKKLSEIRLLEWALGINSVPFLSDSVFRQAGMPVNETGICGAAPMSADLEAAREEHGIPTPEWEKRRWAAVEASRES